MRKKSHSIGDTVYVGGMKGKVTAVDATNGSATVHSQKDGKLLGTAPALNLMNRAPKDFEFPDYIPTRENLAIARDDYFGKDFDVEPVPAEGETLRAQAASQLGRYKADYWTAIASGDEDDIAVAKKAIEFQAVVTGADTKAIFEGVCGIDGCGVKSKGGFEPDHFPLSSCRSGGHTHCTCDACF